MAHCRWNSSSAGSARSFTVCRRWPGGNGCSCRRAFWKRSSSIAPIAAPKPRTTPAAAMRRIHRSWTWSSNTTLRWYRTGDPMLTFELDTTAFHAGLVDLHAEMALRTKASSEVTAGAIVREAQGRVKRRTGAMAEGIHYEESRDATGWVVLAIRADRPNGGVCREFRARATHARAAVPVRVPRARAGGPPAPHGGGGGHVH